MSITITRAQVMVLVTKCDDLMNNHHVDGMDDYYCVVAPLVAGMCSGTLTPAIVYASVEMVYTSMYELVHPSVKAVPVEVEKKGIRLPSIGMPSMEGVKGKLSDMGDSVCEKTKDAKKAGVRVLREQGAKAADVCWDHTKKGLTTTGKAVVGVAVAGTVGAIGWSIKSMFSN